MPVSESSASVDAPEQPENDTHRPCLAWVAGTDLERWLPLLERLKTSFRLVLAGNDGEQIQELRDNGWNAFDHGLGRALRPWRELGGLWRLRRRLKQYRPDVVVFTGRKLTITGPLAGRLARVPLVMRMISGLGTLHSYGAPAVLRRRRLMEGALRLSRNLADVTLFQCATDRQRYARLGIIDARRSRVIAGLGSSVEEPTTTESHGLHRLAVRRRLGLPDDCELVLMLSRLTRSKGVHDLIKASPILQSQRPGCCIVVAGRRNVEAIDSLSDMTLTDFQRNVLWLGERSDEEDLLRAADLFLYPSFYREGVPRALVRAARFGVPMVAADSDASRQVIDHAESGWLVPKHRPKQLAEAVVKLLEDRTLAADLAAEAKRRVTERFSLPRAADELSTLSYGYLAALNRRQRRRVAGTPFDALL